ncbi:MAG: MATE family efflux transporter [Angustibacter sp.]
MSAEVDAGRAANLARVARGGTANLAGAVVMAASTLALTMVVTHGLSKTAAGIFFSTTSVFLLLSTLAQLGTNTGLVFFLSRARATGTRDVRWIYRTAVGPVLVVGVLLGVAMLVLAPQISAVVNPGHRAGSDAYLRALAVFIPLAAVENVTLAGTRGLGTMRPNVVVEQLGRPLLQLALVTLALALGAPDVLVVAWSVAYLPAAVAAHVWWRRLVARQAGGDEVPAMARSEFWRFSGPRALASLAQIAMQRLDIVLVAGLAGPVAAAVYTASTRFLVVGQMGNRAISMAVQPRLGEALAVRDVPAARHLYAAATAWLMLVTWPLYLLFIVFGQTLMRVFGEGYTAGRPVLVTLSATMLFATACGMVDMVLNMAGRTSWNLINVVISLGLQVAIDILLIPRLGVLGAAIGWAAAIVASNVLALSQVAVSMRLHPFSRATAAAAAACSVCFGLLPWAVSTVLGRGWWALVTAVVVAGLSYLAALRWLRGTLELGSLRALRRMRRAPARG